MGIARVARVLDLAAGTGKLTRALLDSGATLTAVESVVWMREQLERTTPGVRILEGTAERIPLPDGEQDAVVVAQAFHWFDAGPAAAEIHRMLRLDGGLGVIWKAETFGHVVVGNLDTTLLARVASVSSISALDSPGRARALAGVRQILAEDSATSRKPELAMPHTTHVRLFRRFA